MTTIALPWPPSELSPNARVHWGERSRKAKNFKRDCWALTLASKAKVTTDGYINLRVTFRPPSKVKRDMDNMIASAKYAMDGMAMALGVDDSRFRSQYVVGDPIKGGAVEVEILGVERTA